MVYGFAARRLRWPAALTLAWLAFLAVTALATTIHLAAVPALALACAAFIAGRALLPNPQGGQTPSRAGGPPAWDLPVRAGCAAAMVLAITAASAGLGARLSGLLAPSPVITTVLAAFTHAQLGPDTTLRLLRGMLTGFFAFALFSATVALTLPHTSIAVAFALATAVAALTQAAILGGEAVGSRP